MFSDYSGKMKSGIIHSSMLPAISSDIILNAKFVHHTIWHKFRIVSLYLQCILTCYMRSHAFWQIVGHFVSNIFSAKNESWLDLHRFTLYSGIWSRKYPQTCQTCIASFFSRLSQSSLPWPRKETSGLKKNRLNTWQCVKTLYPCSSHQNSW